MSCMSTSVGCFVGLALLCGAAPVASAGDWYVDVGFAGCASGDGSAGNPFCGIMDAVAAASGGDTIHIAPGSYFEHLDVDKDLVLVGTGGRDVTIVDGTSNGRTLRVQIGVTVDVTGITFTHGLAFPGAGILVRSNAVLTLTKSSVFRNGDLNDPTSGGGGIAVASSGTAILTDCLVEKNASAYKGTGIRMADLSVVTLTRCGVNANSTGLDNFGGLGAGIYNVGGTLTIVGSSVSRNYADKFGDASRGGGIYTSGGALSISASSICDNSAFSFYSDASGGGIHVNTANAVFDDVVVTGNAVSSTMGNGLGAGVYFQQAATLTHSTFAGNLATHGGGAYVQTGLTVTFGHAILAGNSSSAGTSPDCDGTLTSAGYVLVGDTIGCVVTSSSTRNQLDVDPLFLDAANGDYRLSVGSPALEAGDPALLLAGTDAAGQPRVLDADLDRVMVVDLGGYEFSHVTLAVSGNATPGGTVTLDSTGTSGLALFLFVGTVPGEVLFKPFGRIFFSLASPWLIVPLGTLPDSTSFVVASNVPVGTIVFLQDLAFDPPSSGGNLSNAVEVRIE